MSDPAAKETRAMAQTVDLLDFQLLNFQQLSVMEVSFLLPQSIEWMPNGRSGGGPLRLPKFPPNKTTCVPRAGQIARQDIRARS
jgi:hypothetical protein